MSWDLRKRPSRNYFGGNNFKEGEPTVRTSSLSGPEGGIVVLDDVTIWDQGSESDTRTEQGVTAFTQNLNAKSTYRDSTSQWVGLFINISWHSNPYPQHPPAV